MPDFISGLKKEELEKRLATLTEQYKAANAQLRGTLSASEKPILKEQIEQLGLEIQQIDEELSQITIHPTNPIDASQQDDLQQVEDKLNAIEVLLRQFLIEGDRLTTTLSSDDVFKAPPGAKPGSLEERDWLLLLRRIKDGKCTPFLGSGMGSGVFPSKPDIAQKWAQAFGYPLEDPRNLVRVAQFLAVEYDPMFPKEEWLNECATVSSPDFADSDEPHCILADLPLPVYITTNYDDFMLQALKSRHKDPKLELCRWNSALANQPSVFEKELSYEPTPASPVVFHLHGCYKHENIKLPESLVLNEDDYFEFLINISKDQDLIPPRVQRALAGTSLLFLGYHITDWDFRVLFRILNSYLGRSLSRAHVSVQLVPSEDEFSKEQIEKVQAYLNRYFGKLEIRVYWGTSREFTTELKQRWEVFSRDQ